MIKPEYREKAAQAIANLWAEQITQPFNKDAGMTGNNGDMFFLLSALTTMHSQQNITVDQIEQFKQTIIEQLINRFANDGSTIVSTDYGPDELLGKACFKSGISAGALPIKSITWVNEQLLEVHYKFGYTAQPTSIKLAA